MLPLIPLFALLAAASPEAAVERAVAALDAVERATPVQDAWHAKHRIVARGSDARSLELVATADPAAETHFGQFAVVLARHGRSSAALERSQRLAVTLDAIDALASDPLLRGAPADRAERAAWRRRPDVIAARRRWSDLDLSWAIEAIARDRAARKRPLSEEWSDARGRRVSVAALIDANLRLLALDEAAEAIHFVPEYGVHALMMLCRVIPLYDFDPAAEEELRRFRAEAGRLFARLATGSGDPRHFTPSLLSLAGHLLEIAYDPRAYHPETIDAARMQVLAEELARRIEEGDAPRDYGFVTHTLRGLRNYLARTKTR